MILRLEMKLLFMFYGRKNMIYHQKNLKHTKNNTFNNVFAIEFFLNIVPY